MGVERKVLTPGNGQDFPRPGSMVTMHYTGGTYDQAAGPEKHFMGAMFVSFFSLFISYIYTSERERGRERGGMEKKETNANDKNSFDSSKKPGRGPFATKIGVGRLIQGMFFFLFFPFCIGVQCSAVLVWGCIHTYLGSYLVCIYMYMYMHAIYGLLRI